MFAVITKSKLLGDLGGSLILRSVPRWFQPHVKAYGWLGNQGVIGQPLLMYWRWCQEVIP